MAIAEGELQCVLAGRLNLVQRDVQFAGLQHRVAVALHFGRGRMHAEEFGR